MKVLGADAIAYWQAWPLGDGWYYDSVGNIDITDDDDKVLINPDTAYDADEFGVLAYQGAGQVRDEKKDFAREVTRWMRAQTHKRLVIELPREQESLLRDLAKAHKWRVS